MAADVPRVALWADLAPHFDAAAAALDAAGATYVVVPPGAPVPPDARGATVHIVGGGTVPAEALESLQGTRLVVRAGVGIDRVDLDAARRMGMAVTNIGDYATHEVADQAVTLLLAAWRRLEHFRAAAATMPWPEADTTDVPPLQGSTLGLLGCGRIGGQVAARLQAFGMRAQAYDPYAAPESLRAMGVEPVGFDELLATSDAFSLHAPLTPDSHHILDRAAFARMQRRPVIVNTARGALIDTDALLQALDRNLVRAAGLDTLDGEPQPPDLDRVINHPRIIVTPHMGWYSDAAAGNLGRLAVATALHFVAHAQLPPGRPDLTHR